MPPKKNNEHPMDMDIDSNDDLRKFNTNKIDFKVSLFNSNSDGKKRHEGNGDKTGKINISF